MTTDPPSVGPCLGAGCQHRRVGCHPWRSMSPAARSRAMAAGFRRSVSRGLCSRCYKAALRAGNLETYPPLNRTREVVLSEVAHLFPEHPDRPRAHLIREAAPRLGMTESALEQAITRSNRARTAA